MARDWRADLDVNLGIGSQPVECPQDGTVMPAVLGLGADLLAGAIQGQGDKIQVEGEVFQDLKRQSISGRGERSLEPAFLGIPDQINGIRALQRVSTGEDNAPDAQLGNICNDALGILRIYGVSEAPRSPTIGTGLAAFRGNVKINRRYAVQLS